MPNTNSTTVTSSSINKIPSGPRFFDAILLVRWFDRLQRYFPISTCLFQWCKPSFNYIHGLLWVFSFLIASWISQLPSNLYQLLSCCDLGSRGMFFFLLCASWANMLLSSFVVHWSSWLIGAPKTKPPPNWKFLCITNMYASILKKSNHEYINSVSSR